MQQKSIPTNTAEETARIFGSYDCNAREIEKAFSVTIHNRATDIGDSILISGEEANVRKAAETVEYLKRMAAYSELSEQSVGYVIGMVADGRAGELGALDDDCICITNRGKPIKAKTVGQKKYVEMIRRNTIVLGVGPAGTGKTFLAVAMAVKALREKQVNRIILTRPAVEAGEKLGFLPGDLQNKIDPYLRPLYDALFEMMGAENYARCLEKQTIEIAPLAYMRGRTLDDSFIILDEAQNATPEQMKMFLTRLGFNSKAVVTGDLTQTDLPDGKKSGLGMAVKILRDIEDIGIHYFTERDVVRHKLVQKIILAYEKYERTNAQKNENRGEQKRYRPMPRRETGNFEKK
jgi:phosphate starvation-inducible PhoH-like protein